MDTGSLVNLVQGRSQQRVPEVGMGCTFLHWTDRSAGTIVEIKSETTIVVQEDNSKRTDENGVSECQTYDHTPNIDAPVQTFTLRKNGAWIRQGEPMKNGQRIAIGYRDTYHDFSF